MFTDNATPLQAIFRHAVSLEPRARAAYVATACGTDVELFDEVSALLASDERIADRDILATPFSIRPVLDAPDDEISGSMEVGQPLGPYRLVRTLGRGGMGCVYLAVRSDVHKLVAVKVLRAIFHSPRGTSRFLLERKLLARLDHPNIARFLDAGLRADGVPYFVMEYVDGQPLFEHARGLAVDGRLRLFDGVCAAVAYAHQHLVVHRDLKPSNILVDRSGAVKLLDFGIAKLLAEQDEELTGFGMRPMTLDYAAPEQVRGEPVTPAADVYALGVLLFELLTGERPYSLRDLPPAQIEREICETAVPRPSTRVQGGRPPRRNADDLDAICLRALEKAPERRYPTAAELRADILRYLSQHPVEARMPTTAYVVRKFVARHRGPVAAAAAIGALLLAGSAGVAWHAERAEQERERAELALRESESVSGFLVDLFEAQNPNSAQGAAPSARELIERGVQRAELLTAHPPVQARMLDTIGRVYQGIGDLAAAERLLRRALEIRQSQLGPTHPDTAASLHNLGNLLFEKGEYDEADRQYAAALSVRREVLGARHPDLAATLAGHGEFLVRVRGDTATGEAQLREALAIVRSTLDADDARVASTLNAAAAAPIQRGDYAAAEALFREALSIHTSSLGRAHPDSIVTLNNLGTTLVARGDLDGAEAALREALDLNRRVHGATHHNVAIGLNNLAALLKRRGRLAEAAATERQAIALAAAALGPDHPTVVRMSKRLLQIEALRRTPAAVPPHGPDHTFPW